MLSKLPVKTVQKVIWGLKVRDEVDYTESRYADFFKLWDIVRFSVLTK
jgi:hypothetical protein